MINLLFFRNLKSALNEFEPQLVVYNAGTDILQGDPLGLLNISPQVGINLYATYIPTNKVSIEH